MADPKDFYFKFYAREYLTDSEIRSSPIEVQGILPRLWCLCCLDGSMPSDLDELSLASGVQRSLLQTFQRSWQRFFQRRVEDGRYYSPRMERERESRLKTKAGASKAGKASAAKRTPKQAPTNVTTNVTTNVEPDTHEFNERVNEISTLHSSEFIEKIEPYQEKNSSTIDGTSTPPTTRVSGSDTPEIIDEYWQPENEEFSEPTPAHESLVWEPLERALAQFSPGDQQKLIEAEATLEDIKNINYLTKTFNGTLEFVQRNKK